MKFSLLLLSMFLLHSIALAADTDLEKELSLRTSEVNPAEVSSYRRVDGATVTEYKNNGRVWMIKIQPAGDFPPYYLYDDEGNGNFQQRIAGNKRPSPPMWIIKSW